MKISNYHRNYHVEINFSNVEWLLNPILNPTPISSCLDLDIGQIFLKYFTILIRATLENLCILKGFGTHPHAPIY